MTFLVAHHLKTLLSYSHYPFSPFLGQCTHFHFASVLLHHLLPNYCYLLHPFQCTQAHCLYYSSPFLPLTISFHCLFYFLLKMSMSTPLLSPISKALLAILTHDQKEPLGIGQLASHIRSGVLSNHTT